MAFLRWHWLFLSILILGVSCRSAADSSNATDADQPPFPDGDVPIVSREPTPRPSPPRPPGSPSPQVSPSPSPTPNDDRPWITLNGNGVSLSLPPDYDGGNPSQDFQQLQQKLNAINPSYARRFASIQDNPESIALLAFDRNSKEAEFLTNVTVAVERVPTEVSMEQYVQAAGQQLSQAYKIEAQALLTVGTYPAGQIVGTIVADNDVPVKQLFYLVQAENQFWIITYATTAAEFEQRLPTFQRSIQSLKLSS
ncbi:hypothetical protein [Spirulina major]|uniref:hypothetical protein n=1 Tax=Spirulina major TaxID=270636 RepID=UPI000932300E|nr:hypothetical protein [Spirulina major]